METEAVLERCALDADMGAGAGPASLAPQGDHVGPAPTATALNADAEACPDTEECMNVGEDGGGGWNLTDTAADAQLLAAALARAHT